MPLLSSILRPHLTEILISLLLNLAPLLFELPHARGPFLHHCQGVTRSNSIGIPFLSSRIVIAPNVFQRLSQPVGITFGVPRLLDKAVFARCIG